MTMLWVSPFITSNMTKPLRNLVGTQWAIPSSTVQKSSWPVEGNVTNNPTSGKSSR